MSAVLDVCVHDIWLLADLLKRAKTKTASNLRSAADLEDHIKKINKMLVDFNEGKLIPNENPDGPGMWDAVYTCGQSESKCSARIAYCWAFLEVGHGWSEARASKVWRSKRRASIVCKRRNGRWMELGDLIDPWSGQKAHNWVGNSLDIKTIALPTNWKFPPWTQQGFALRQPTQYFLK